MKKQTESQCPSDAASCSESSSSREGITLPNQHGGIKKLASREDIQSWVVKCASLVFGRDLSPGFDIVLLLESPDGTINHLRIIMASMGKPNGPGIVRKPIAPCRLSVLWNENEIVTCILRSVGSRSDALSFLLKLVSILSHVKDWSSNFSSERQSDGNPTSGSHR
jgi:hypothetical protein